MKRAPLARSTKPLARNVPLRSTSAPQTRTPLTRTKRTNGIAYKPRRQPLHSPWPMTCTPELRAELIAEADNRCTRCHRWFSDWMLSLSRIVPGSKGGPYTRWNCWVMCGDGTRGCHGDIEASPATAEREGWRVPGSFVSGCYVGPDESYERVVVEALNELRETA